MSSGDECLSNPTRWIKKWILMIFGVSLVLLFVGWRALEEEPSNNPETKQVKAVSQPDPQPERGLVPVAVNVGEGGVGESVSQDERVNPLEQIRAFLPQWLLDEGQVYHDTRVINGQTVYRSRGRYSWDGGEQLEIEITDVGAAADEALVKGLGFDLGQTQSKSEAGYTSTSDLDGYLINQEYSYEDQSGSIQLLVEDRYLIEVQIEQLSEDAFQEVIDSDIPFAAIFSSMQAESNAED